MIVKSEMIYNCESIFYDMVTYILPWSYNRLSTNGC